MADVDSISKYKLVGRLGQGGMAAVYLAITQGPAGFAKLQVVKLLHGNLAGDSEFVKMFLHEARLAALLNHPNVVQTNEVGFEKGRCFLVMEYLEGQSLAVVLAGCKRTGKKLEMTQHLRVLAEVLAGLHYAHELTDLEGRPLGLVHRDVSPHNVMVGYDGAVKLLDFGIAKATATAPDTRADIMKGKVRYMAPEQVTKEVLDRRADIFQVGIMFFQAVTGKPYWPKDLEHMAVVSRLYSGHLPDLDQVEPPMDEDLAAICRRALARSPLERYATAEEFRKDIEAAVARRDTSVTPRQVGEFVAQLFVEQRTKVKKEIEESLRNSQFTSVPLDQIASIPPSAMPELTSANSASNTRSYAESHEAVTDPGLSSPNSATSIQRGAVSSTVTRTRPERRLLIVAISAGVLLLALSIAFLPALLRRNDPSGSAAQTSSGTQQSVAPSAPPSSPPALDKVEVRIAVEPSSAILYLDGAQLPGNPYTGRVDNDAKPHKIKATATGYQTREVETTWAQSPNVSLTLEPVARKVPVGVTAPPKSTAPGKTSPTSTVAPPKIRDER